MSWTLWGVDGGWGDGQSKASVPSGGDTSPVSGRVSGGGASARLSSPVLCPQGAPRPREHARPGLCGDAHTHVPAVTSPESWKLAERGLERLSYLMPSWRREHRPRGNCLQRPWEQRWGALCTGHRSMFPPRWAQGSGQVSPSAWLLVSAED